MFGKKILALCFFFFLYSGCTPTTTVYTIPSGFDASEAENLLVEGTNSVKGRAVINFNEGGKATCINGLAVLVPATKYAKERMQVIFGDKEVLFHPRMGVTENIEFEPDEPSFARLVKTASCDVEGNFEFAKLTDGEFIVVVKISWATKRSFHGAEFMRQVRLENGVTAQLDFTKKIYRHPYEARFINR